jgi:hypothetical protein
MALVAANGRRECSPLNLEADGVLLLIERLLLAFGDMAAVDFGHVTLLLANRVVFPVKLVGLLFGDFAFFQFTVDSAVLVCKPVIDLIAARVVALPLKQPTRQCRQRRPKQRKQQSLIRRAWIFPSSAVGKRSSTHAGLCPGDAELAVRCAFNSGSSNRQNRGAAIAMRGQDRPKSPKPYLCKAAGGGIKCLHRSAGDEQHA